MPYALLLQGQLVWNIPLFISMVCVAFFYVYVLNRLTNIKMYQIHAFFFFLGLGLLYITIGSPLSSISHLSFSLHMIQMSILYFIIPPIILLGIPACIFEKGTFPIIKWNRPLPLNIPLYTFALLFFMYHIPVILQIISQNALLQNGYLLLLFIISFGMWWPITSPNPKHRLCPQAKKRYTLLSGLILMPACMLFILTAMMEGGNNPFLNQITAQLCLPAQSSSFNILPPPFNTKFDQVMAGIWMLGLHKFGLFMTFKIENKVQQPN